MTFRSPEERIRKLKEPTWIGYPQAISIRDHMDDLLANPRMHRMPNLGIYGESYNGKSMLLRNFARRHDPTLSPDYDVNSDDLNKPVFLFQAPPEPDEGRLYNRMLEELHSFASPREPADVKLSRIIKILEALRTKIILIDEFGFFQAGTPAKQRKALNALKFIGNETQIPLVVAAIPETLNLMQGNSEVANRFDNLFLPKWKMGDDYLRLLISLEKSIKLEMPSNLAREDVAQRLLDESGGVIGYLCDLVRRLAIDAIRTGMEHIPAKALDPGNLKRLGWTNPRNLHRYPG